MSHRVSRAEWASVELGLQPTWSNGQTYKRLSAADLSTISLNDSGMGGCSWFVKLSSSHSLQICNPYHTHTNSTIIHVHNYQSYLSGSEANASSWCHLPTITTTAIRPMRIQGQDTHKFMHKFAQSNEIFQEHIIKCNEHILCRHHFASDKYRITKSVLATSIKPRFIASPVCDWSMLTLEFLS